MLYYKKTFNSKREKKKQKVQKDLKDWLWSCIRFLSSNATDTAMGMYQVTHVASPALGRQSHPSPVRRVRTSVVDVIKPQSCGNKSRSILESYPNIAMEYLYFQ